MPRRLHNSIYQGIRNSDVKIIEALKNYYKLSENTSQVTDASTFAELPSGAVSNKDLKYTIIDAFRYVNSTYIAKEPAFQPYVSIINSAEFMSDKSSVASDNPNIINLSFSKLADVLPGNKKTGTNLLSAADISEAEAQEKLQKQITDPLKIEATITDVKSFTISDMCKIYKEAVFGWNLDAVYRTYKFNGYTVLDNSGPHTPNSLVRLCDIAEIGEFGIYDTGGTKNITYRYNEFIIASLVNATARAVNTIENPYRFEVDTRYLPTNESLDFQIVSIQITDSGVNGVGRTNTLTEEAAAFYKQYLITNKISMNPNIQDVYDN